MHDIKSESGQKTAIGIGFLVSTVMLMGSAYFNFLFAYKLGRTPMDGIVFGILGVAVDVFLILMPFYFVSALRAREWIGGIFCLAVWVVLIGVSANAAIGHIAGSRIDAMSNKMAAATSYQDVRAELKRLNERLGWLPKPTDSQDSLKAKIKAQQSQLVWAQTSECVNQWNTTAKTFCAKMTELTSALTNTIEYDKTVARIAELQAKSDAAVNNHVTVIADGADAQASLYAKALGVDVTTASGAISGLFAGVILMISSMGFWLSLTPAREAQRRRKAAEEAAALDAEVPPATVLTAEPARLMIDHEVPSPPTAPAQAPVRPVSGLIAPPVTDEARELLLAIGMPDKPCDKRPPDKDEVLGYRFLAWLIANNYTGTFTPDQIDNLYNVYVIADNRQPNAAMRIVKNRLELTGPRFVKKEANATRDDGSRGAVWTIRKVSIPVLSGVLMKRGVIPDTSLPDPEPEATEPQPQNVYPLFSKGEAANG